MYKTPVIVSDVNSDVLHVTDELQCVKELFVQPQYRDKSTQVPKSSNCYHMNSTNTTNVYQNFNSNRGQADRADEQLWSLGHHHQGSIFQSLEANTMIQNVSIFNRSPHMEGPTDNSQLKGFYNVYTEHSFNICLFPEPVAGTLEVSRTVQIKPDWISNYVNTHSHEVMKLTKQSHTDFYLDFKSHKLYNYSYEHHIVNIIDELILRGSGEHEILDTKVQDVNMNNVNME